MAVFQKLSNDSLRERIAQKIKEAILTGELREGERLVERKLAGQFETSLTAVREALVQLESEGFVSKKANSATHVAKFSFGAAEKIFRVRKVLEAFAVEEAARAASPDQIRQLEKSYVEYLDKAREQKVLEFVVKDLALHEKIWELAGNEYLVVALKRVVQPMFALTAIRLVSSRPFDLLHDAHSHLPVIEAIKSKNPENARQTFLAALDYWYVEQCRWASEQSERGADISGRTEQTAEVESQN